MTRTVRGRYRNGVIELLEQVELPEDTEITIVEAKPEGSTGALERSAGAWKGLLDADKLIRDIYADKGARYRKTPAPDGCGGEDCC
jgi:predicted DNA-binding antitoxin AbrB/MazE fold protein